MTTRTVQTTAVFTRPFTLEGVEGELPAGSYLIETEEERIDAISFEAYHRIATTIALPAIGSASLKRQVVTIDPRDLAAAQKRDVAYSQSTINIEVAKR